MTDQRFFQTGYDRAACDIGVVHLGYGAFHRAHQAVYLDDHMEATGDLRWGIAAVNLRAAESAQFRNAAGEGYVLKSITPDGGKSFRAVRPHLAFVDAAKDLDAGTKLFARASVTTCTITVTESGYDFADDWSLDLTAGPIAAELAGGPVRTVYGFLAAALARRADLIDQPLNILCCDNIRDNGRVLEAALLRYLEAAGRAELADWVRARVAFPCSMVDRITPRSTPELRAEINGLWPDHAATAIHAEAFRQWVLEDRFAAPFPDLARVGVEIVSDVRPYEEAKIRILNGGHTGLAYLGALAGHRTFDAAMADPALRAHFDAWEMQEVLPGLGRDIPFDTRAYLDEIARRFENPGIADQLERICMDGYSKMGIYIRPTLAACLEAGTTPRAGYDCVASWVVFARRHLQGRAPVPYHEPLWPRLEPLLAPERVDDLARDPNLWGDLPDTYDTFTPDLVAAIERMDTRWQG